jgi:signal transduction histidine kinase
MVPECWTPSIQVNDAIEGSDWRPLPPGWAVRPAATIGAPVEKLDIGAIVKESQAVSCEIDPDKLIETLMRIALERTGAERGLLILLPGDAPLIEAEATRSDGRVAVVLRQAPVTPTELPESLLHHAIRTRETVILDDAATPTLFSTPASFSTDVYIRQRQPRSVLCLPFVKQARLVGVLYLESYLKPRAFTSDRVAVLELLASQAAVSLENAALRSALHNAQADLARMARLTTMGELATSIAHEINQPLSAIVMNANACLRWLANERRNPDEARAAAQRIVRDGLHASEIIRSIRALARKTAPEMVLLDINDTIRKVLVLMRNEFCRHDISFQIDCSDNLAPVLGDPVQLQQVILNLMMNGVEALGTVTDRPRELRLISEIDGPGTLRVAVEDSGPGLAPEVADRVFDAFFTTKPNGTGMGLSICRSIIDAHGGRLWASSRSPQGAVFQFTLPIAASIAP